MARFFNLLALNLETSFGPTPWPWAVAVALRRHRTSVVEMSKPVMAKAPFLFETAKALEAGLYKFRMR